MMMLMHVGFKHGTGSSDVMPVPIKAPSWPILLLSLLEPMWCDIYQYDDCKSFVPSV